MSANAASILSPPVAPDRRRVGLATVLFVVGLGGLNVGMLIFAGRSSPGGVTEDALASALLWVAAFPAWRFFVSRRRTSFFFPVIGIVYALYFAFPRFTGRELFRTSLVEPPSSSVAPALAIALAGVVCLVAGYEFGGALVARVPRVTRVLDLERALPWFVGCSALGFAISVATTGVNSSLWGQVLLVIKAISELSNAGVLLACLRRVGRRWHLAWFLGLAVAQALYGVSTGMLANAVWPIIAYIFVYSWERRSLPVSVLLILAIGYFPMQAVKEKFRERYWVGGQTQVTTRNITQQTEGYFKVARDSAASLTFDDMLDRGTSRLNQLATLAVVVDLTPSHIPYWEGYTYSDLAWHFIPRFLVPDKPSPGIGQEFPRRYGLLDYMNTSTSYNLPQLVEFYINFGELGVILGMAIIGLIYRTLDHGLAAEASGVLMAAPLMARMLNVESNFSLVFGGIPFQLVVYYMFMRMLPSIRGNEVGGSRGNV